MSKKEGKAFDGVQAVAEMLNHMDPESRDKLLKSLAQKDPGVTERIRGQMLTFDHLIYLEDRDLQVLLREVAQTFWVLALRKCSAEIEAAIYRNLSKRAGELLHEEVARIGPQKLSDVRAAQDRILAAAKQLDAEGKIALRR